MLLANELFEEVLGTLTASAGVPAAAAATTGPTGGGKRREPRIPLNQRLTLFPFAPGAEGLAGYDFPRNAKGGLEIPLSDPLSVPVRDLSRGGLRFLMPRRLPLDTPFVLLLPRVQMAGSPMGRPTPTAVECTVTYWQPIQRDLFGIGARFLRLLTGFARPLSTLTAASSPRSSPRFKSIALAPAATLRTPSAKIA